MKTSNQQSENKTEDDVEAALNDARKAVFAAAELVNTLAATRTEEHRSAFPDLMHDQAMSCALSEYEEALTWYSSRFRENRESLIGKHKAEFGW